MHDARTVRAGEEHPARWCDQHRLHVMRRGKLARASRDLFQSVTLDNASLSKLGGPA